MPMHGYPDYRGFNVQVVIIDGDRQLAEFVRREVNRYFPRDVVADHEPMEAYEKLLDAIDDLTDARCLRRVDCLN